MSWKRKKKEPAFVPERKLVWKQKKGGWQASKKCVVIFSGSRTTFSLLPKIRAFLWEKGPNADKWHSTLLSDKSARRTRDIQWDTSWPCLSGDVSFLQDEGANHLEGMPASPNFWVALFPSVSRPSRETGSPERRACRVSYRWVRFTNRRCRHSSYLAPLLPSSS